MSEPFFGCNSCKRAMSKDENDNYRCTTPGCGKGSAFGTDGVSVIIGDDGSMTITSGKSKGGKAKR